MANREIQYNQIGPLMEEQLEKLMQVTVFEADKALKKASPVDTGRFRASWQVSQGVENMGSSVYREKFALNTKGRKKGTVIYETSDKPVKVNYEGQERLGTFYSIHNPLVYAEPLALGHSPQAPDGWIYSVAVRMQNMVDRNYRKITKEI